MHALRAGFDAEGFFDALASAPSRVLLLDYDGTLAPFREVRDEAVPWPGVRHALEGLRDAGGSRLVVVSGRALADLRPLLGMDPTPELWGSHGWERSVPGRPDEEADPGAGVRECLEKGIDIAREVAPPESVEVKPVSVAIHTRGRPPADAASLLKSLRARWGRLVSDGSLVMHRFDGGLELRVPGRDKGTAVHEILASEPAEAGVAYLGDDATDEDAFETLEAREGPLLRALVRPEPRTTRADVLLRPPEDVLAFLTRWGDATLP